MLVFNQKKAICGGFFKKSDKPYKGFYCGNSCIYSLLMYLSFLEESINKY
jgi:hypothetical protein